MTTTYTYDNTLPTSLDRVRFAVGDIDIDDPLRPDEEYTANIDLVGESTAIVIMARSLAAEYARQPVRVSAAGASVDFSQRVTTWLALATAALTQVDFALVRLNLDFKEPSY